jgi:hypothetical protein
MSESFIIAILGIAGTLLTGVISFTLGQHAERRKQTILIRAEMLKPIDEWLKGFEKLVGIFSDTISSIALNMPLPMNYDFNERKNVFNFMSEKTNEVLGIIASNSLVSKKSKKLAEELSEVIIALDKLAKLELLPKENELVFRSNEHTLTNHHLREAGNLKLTIDALLQTAYKLVSQIKTVLT